MVAVLFCITLISSGGVGLVNLIPVEHIAVATLKAVNDAVLAVLPAFDDKKIDELEIDAMPIKVYTATAEGKTIGYAVETMTKKGFGGVVKLMVGFAPTGEVLNVNVLQQTETPGLGTKMCDEGNPLISSIKGQNLESKKLVNGQLAVTKDGGDVDALTAATISSRAYVDAVNRAYMAYKSVANGTEPTDVSSGASKVESAQKGGNNE
ncbi:MAG: RnfABCDGE type electron transport complex subunit G [Alistipes sp.]|nr:RnfABCDGE type electron transport complex subunit G [Alistipes sp.]